MQKSCSSWKSGEDPSTEAEWKDGGRRELTSETWRPLEYKQSRREESEKSVDSVGSVFYEDVDVYR